MIQVNKKFPRRTTIKILPVFINISTFVEHQFGVMAICLENETQVQRILWKRKFNYSDLLCSIKDTISAKQ